MHLTQETVRTAMLAAQGLLCPPESHATKNDILPIIRQIGYLQIDTIQAVKRSQHLVLWSRLGAYEPAWLDEIHTEGCLFEYYAHALCYLPIEDYPIFRGLMLFDDRTGNGWQKWADAHPEVVEHVRSVIKENGPVCSADFDSETIPTGWGDAKQEKLALSRLFSTGELMIPYRAKFRRYFDFRARVLPDWDDADALDPKSARKALLLKTIHALGVAREDWLTSYYYMLKTGLSDVLTGLVVEGQLLPVQVAGWNVPGYIHADQIQMVEATTRGELNPTYTTFLSPFDPLVSDRGRALDLFDFDYRMESYTPARDRKYGYFCLPILHKGRLVGRLDPKAHRQEKRMEIKKIHLESSVEITEDLVTDLKNTLQKFTAWHGMATLEVTTTEPSELRAALV